MPYAVLVFACLITEAAIVVRVFLRADFAGRRKAGFAAAMVASIALKLMLAAAGHNYDVESYRMVASLVHDGKSVYANTDRYNYAPVWSYFLAGVQYVTQLLPAQGQETFHIGVAGLLAVTDAALAALLAAGYSYGAGMFLLCSPATALLTGYHSQFEALALLPGLAAWLLIRRGSAPTLPSLASGLLLGLSLAVKHILFLFPVWLLFFPRLGSFRKRLGIVAVAYATFGVSFLPAWIDPASRAGILKNVFGYRSMPRLSILHFLVGARGSVEEYLAASAFLTPLWMAAILALGLLRRRRTEDPFPMYLLAMFSLSPALADQYLAIPLLACAIWWRNWPAWAVLATATAALLRSPTNVFQVALNPAYVILMPTSQICAGALFAIRCGIPGNGLAPVRALPESLVRAVALVLAGAMAVFVLIAFRGW
jgi:hypothetical protein